MPCYHPLKAFPIGVTFGGKPKYKIVPYATHHLEQYTNGGAFIPVSNDFYTPSAVNYRSEFITVPCGKCVGCRIDYSRSWANRCMLELQYHDSSYFLTLTYDDDHVPRSCVPDAESGEYNETLSLCKRDFQLFMKRLRKTFSSDKIRFYGCGEYGTITYRPHYHVIVFGLHLDDIVPYKKSNQGYQYYTSEKLQKVWQNGYVVVGQVTWETCAYTARYVMKKANQIEAEAFDNFGIQREFVDMSRKPGIARQYFDEHPEIYDFDNINISTTKGGKSFKPPKYFDKLFDVDHHEVMLEIKERRLRAAEAAQKAICDRTDLSYEEYLQVAERSKTDRLKKLERNVV